MLTRETRRNIFRLAEALAHSLWTLVYQLGASADKYEIMGDDMQLLNVNISGDTLVCEGGSMSFMPETAEMGVNCDR